MVCNSGTVAIALICFLNLVTADNRVSGDAVVHHPYLNFLRRLLPQPSSFLMCRSLIEEPALSFENAPKDIIADEGEEAFLACSVFSNPQADILWYHENELVSEQRAASQELLVNRRVMGTSIMESHLRIPCLNSKTVGEYKCQARTPCGQYIIASATVNMRKTGKRCSPRQAIEEPAWIKLITINRLELAGNLIELVCRVGGSPFPAIKWDKIDDDGEVVNADGILLNDKEVLLVQGDKNTVSESYRCTATNKYGEAFADSTVVYADDG